VAIQTESIKTYSKGSGGESMATEMRKTGVDAVGDVVSWGAHETKEDLLTAPAMISFLAAWLFVSVG
jgi:hypothetical protein